jgi:hypothetical protein
VDKIYGLEEAGGTCTLFVSRRIDFSGNSVTLNKFKNHDECGTVGLPEVEGGRLVRLVA